jgi:prepilin-type N-terminal cleavage/methylation domain-containing protein
MKVRKGFTLIELLVVVAIIALLIAILLPALGRAKTIAKRTVCLTNMKAIAQGTRAYATGNEDLLPEVSGQAANNYIEPEYGTYTALDLGNQALTRQPNNPGVGLGRLFATGYISDMRIAWCPTQPNTAFNTDPANYRFPWPSQWSSGAVMYRSSYNYLPNHSGTVGVAYTKLTQVPEFVAPSSPTNPYAGAGEFLAIDLIQNSAEEAHVDNNGAPMWNAVWADGHAASIKAPGIVTQLNGAGIGSKSWTRFDTAMNILITNAANGQSTQ